ncbi:hypothetical protein PhCBS80983_g03931 [Powellomyces hirtus]|uniref:SET domain-containing protein n=1 Tax=Powellomyces hirtus TaxID=109895 RepID=A0A507E0P8_9FUNG|nr:hypothetical protein PhCBS80983_g03931 [Powellomyces hirtus]
MGQMSKHTTKDAATFFTARNYISLSATFIIGVFVGSQALKSFGLGNALSGTVTAAPAMDVAPHVPAAVSDDWKTRKYYPKDLSKHFGIHHIDQLEIPAELQPYVDAHDVTTDKQYVDNMDLYQNYARVFGPFLDKLSKGNNDERLYVKWTGDEKKFGVFTNAYIPAYGFVVEYSGLLINSSRSTDYEWHYHSELVDNDGNAMPLGIDSQFVGNIARFVNHDDKPNTDSIYVPWKNTWRIVYVATKNIYPGEELTVSYGPNYWQSRDRLKVPSTDSDE